MVPPSQIGAAPALIAAAATIQRTLDSLHLRHCVIGGIALLRWGEPRFTRDVDLTVLCPYGGEQALGESLLVHFHPRIPDALAFSRESRVLLLEDGERRPIDIALGALPFEERAVERASDFEYAPGVTLRTCGAEDLIVMKAFADRGQDRLDVEGIVARQGAHLDWNLIDAELEPLVGLKPEAGIMSRLGLLRAAPQDSSSRT